MAIEKTIVIKINSNNKECEHNKKYKENKVLMIKRKIIKGLIIPTIR